MKPWTLRDFMRESLRIEGIHRAPTRAEMVATERLLAEPEISVGDIETLVAVYAPGHRLRDQVGLNVRVGTHIAPRGGPDIRDRLAELLQRCAERVLSAFDAHVAYETLHPFTDGNGRSGRALWLWMHGGQAPIGFLHRFYYESLANDGARQA